MGGASFLMLPGSMHNYIIYPAIPAAAGEPGYKFGKIPLYTDASLTG
jgi:hypothetical protein